MVAGLLFIFGLVSVLVSLVFAGLDTPGIVQAYNGATPAGPIPALAGVMAVGQHLAWMVMPVVGGLLLMAVARVIMLLAAINRSLRGEP